MTKKTKKKLLLFIELMNAIFVLLMTIHSKNPFFIGIDMFTGLSVVILDLGLFLVWSKNKLKAKFAK